MKSIDQAFDEFRRTVTLSKEDEARVRKQHPKIREVLRGELEVNRTVLSGSFARKTAIRPIGDIDIFLVLDETRELSRKTPPQAVLNRLAAALAKRYPKNSRRTQPRSGRIKFENTRIVYDLVPAFELGEGICAIPDAERGAWIRTSPKVHAQLSTEANERANKRLKPLLRAVKHANVTHNKLARSFHLEVMSWQILRADPGSWGEGLVVLLEGLAERMSYKCRDPAKLSGDIRPEADKLKQAHEKFSWMAKHARQALELERAGRLPEAHAKLRRVFGKGWSG